ncbi:recombinase family protein [Escherichia coli O157]|nr:recombinase family protein [Escherichia coli O157]
MTVYAYYRVSSDKQRKDRTIESQRYAVAELAERLGVVIAGSYEDEAVSGTVDPKDRPGYSALATSLHKGDILLLDSLDRISRKPSKLQLYVLQLQDDGVEIHCVNQFDEQVLHNDDLGPAMLGIAATIAGLKIKDVRTKTTNALNRIRKECAEGKRDTDKRPGRKADYDPKEVCDMLGKGVPAKVIADRLHISKRTVYYWKAELEGHSRNKEGSISRVELMM